MLGYIYFAMIKSAESMFKNQPDLSKFSEQTHDHEPNLSFHLANELWKFFPCLSCDFDVIKPNQNDKRPDLIFHKRGIPDKNLLVVEVKRKSNNMVKDWRCKSDEKKIHNHWFQGDLLYEFGVSIVIDETTSCFAFTLFQREPYFDLHFPSAFTEALRNKAKEIDLIAEIVDKIIAAKKANPQADTTAWEREIDELVYRLYDLTDEEIKIVEGKI